MPDKYYTHYEILEIAETASDEQIKKAYRRLAQEYHPDKVPPHLSRLKQDAQEKFKQINEAYEILSNPDKRREYDDLLMVLRKGEQKSTSYNNQPDSQPTSSSFPQLYVNKKTFEFLNIQKNSHVSDSFTISNVGGGILSGPIKTNKKWLKVSQNNIDTTKHKQDITFHVDTSGLAFGFRDTGTIEIQSNGGAERVNVTLSIEPSPKRRNKFIAAGAGIAVLIFIIVSIIVSNVGRKNDKHSQSSLNQIKNGLSQPPYQDLPFPQRYVEDRVNIISDTVEKGLNGYLQELEQKTGTQMIVLTINTTGSIPIETYAIELATKWKLGQKGKDNGALVIIAKDDRTYRIEIGRGLEKILPDSFCGTVGRTYFVPNFQKGQFTDGIYQGVVVIGDKIAEDFKQVPYTASTEKDRQYLRPEIPAPQGRRTNLTLAKLTEGIEDAEHFDNKSQVLPYKYDDVWSAVDYVLKDKKEKIIQSDKETGVVITDTCGWFMSREYIKYYILVERINDVSSKLNLKLLAYDSVWNKNLQRSFKEPMNKACVNTRTMKFLESINKRLKNNK